MRKLMKKVKCPDCEKSFGNNGALARHSIARHPYIPPPPPKVTSLHSRGESFLKTYVGSSHLDVGDVFYRIEKHVVKSITLTEGSKDALINSEITKAHWQIEKP